MFNKKDWRKWLKLTFIWMVNVNITFLYNFLYITADIYTVENSGQEPDTFFVVYIIGDHNC